MKTKLTSLIAFFGLCASVSAVSLSWGAIGSTAAIKGLTAGTAMTTGAGSQTASMTIYYFDYADYDTIVDLGKVEASALDSYVVTSAAGQTSDNASAAGRAAKSGTNADYTTSGNSFFARAYTTFGDKTYFIDLFAGNGTGGVWTMTTSGDARTTEKFSWADPAAGTTWGGAMSDTVGTKNAWVAVPEPGTAALALLGIGMLLKRRRA